MGGKLSRTDFEYSYTAEPHASRRKEILAKYPQIKKLMGHDPNFKYQVLFWMAIQLAVTYMVRNVSWPVLFVVAYTIGGVVSHILLFASHELCHNLGFGHSRPLLNRIFSLIANFPIGVPFAMKFKRYHLLHHRYQGDLEFDMDSPSKFEARLFSHNTATKLLWLIFQPFFFYTRPTVVSPRSYPPPLENFNVALQLSFNALVAYYWGVKSVVFMIASLLLGTSFHPMNGHIISEHYMFKEGHETYSYYGPLNWVTFNVGYHNEHHDFPSVPGSRLPLVRDIAWEYYKDLPHHTSWVKVIYDYLTDPAIGPYARRKRMGMKSVGESEEDKNE